jgi:Ser/Thr protein kinase RdoA (MazF antagonist)
LHREYWRSEELHGHFWLLELDIDARIRQGMFVKHLAKYAPVMGPAVASHLAWLSEHGARLLRQFMAQAPSTLLHCDLRLDNVIFDGDKCAFIDFQLVRYGPAAYDVAYFIASALHEDATQEEVEEVLIAYHEALSVSDYDFATFKRDYQRALMVVLCGLASVDDVEFGNERGVSMMSAWLRRLGARVESVELEALL